MSHTRFRSIRADYRAAGGLLEDAPLELETFRDWAIYRNDFHANVDDADLTVTNITSGTAGILAGSANGNLTLVATTANQGLASVQHTVSGSSTVGLFAPAAGRTAIFEAGVSFNRWDDADWFVGVGQAANDFMASSGAIKASTQFVGFHHLEAGDGTPLLKYAGQNGTNITVTPSRTVSAFAANSYHRLGFKVVGTNSIEYYIDGVRVGVSKAASAFNAGMTTTFCMIANGSTCNFLVDYYYVATTR